MPVTTTSAAIHITPVVIKTFITHGSRKARRLAASKEKGKESPQDDIFFDQAFNIVKAFIALGVDNTIESLQAFTNTHVPTPYWAAVSPVLIPHSTCNEAADLLVKLFGPEELKYIVGGERWWQVRGLSGIESEWITQDEFLDPKMPSPKPGERKYTAVESTILRMEKLESVMLYVHGGGYSWGSINTHRYQILHYTRKFKGRAFAVNYRKAPQYPWPCPIQDVLAAYLYLIRPPPGALHKPIPSSKIVFAGDSAGAGLSLSVLTVLRDLGLPMPAGAVLISPWVDLTHSFPSVMENYESDIIPQYGFMAKPSTTWPIPTTPEGGGRVVESSSNPPPKPGLPDTLKPQPHRADELNKDKKEYSPGERIKSQSEMLDNDSGEERVDKFVHPPRDNDHDKAGSEVNPVSKSSSDTSGTKVEQPSSSTDNGDGGGDAECKEDAKEWEPKYAKVLMEDPNATPLEIRSQIQMYATTEQLVHPLVSPILNASLGNLPPLYIIGGDGEVLRDEIIYLAHKAAHPSRYPTRSAVVDGSKRQKENLEKFTKPTKVHLQVFDGMCHVLTVFMFTQSAKYAYQSISEFVKHVTTHDAEHLEKNPFPELHRPLSTMPVDENTITGRRDDIPAETLAGMREEQDRKLAEVDSPVSNSVQEHVKLPSDVNLFLAAEKVASEEFRDHNLEMKPSAGSSSTSTSTPVDSDLSQMTTDIADVLMIRERVDIAGKVRTMEPIEDIKCLNLDASTIGIIKEAPAVRWKTGQDIWDERYARRAKRIIKQKAKYEAKAEKILREAFDQGFVHSSHGVAAKDLENAAANVTEEPKDAQIQVERRWGPLDLDGERPPVSAIAGRRDTPEAIALLKKSIYHSAPRTHRTVPKRTPAETVRAAFDPNDNPSTYPHQSASEEQVKNRVLPVHGLNIWDGIVRYFGVKSSKKAANQVKQSAEKLGLTSSNGDAKDS